MRGTRNRYWLGRRGLGAKVGGALALAGLFAAGVALAASTTVTLRDEGPSPTTVTVKWGDTVTFANAGPKPHAVTIPRLESSSPLLEPGQAWSQVFDGRAGRYPFRQVQGRGFPGLVVVELEGKVTMTAKPEVVTYGKRVAFTGTALPGASVKLEQLLSPQAGEWVERMSFVAGADGKWAASLAPTLTGRFRASAAAGQLRSPTISIGVQPAVTLTAPRGAKAKKVVAVRGLIKPAGAAMTADLERYDADRKRWVRADRRRVPKSGKISFQWEAVKGRSRLRIQLHRFGLKPGFAAVASKPVAVRVP
jgi:plastocyanin